MNTKKMRSLEVSFINFKEENAFRNAFGSPVKLTGKVSQKRIHQQEIRIQEFAKGNVPDAMLNDRNGGNGSTHR